MPSILLTGMPRSGTTLVCALLNQCPDTVALAEPIELERHGDRQRAVAEVEAFLARTRQAALEEGVVPSKHIDGAVPENTVESRTPGPGLRRILARQGLIHVGKPLSADFALIVKHPGEFTALADLLVHRLPLFAIVRNPLAVLAAWQTVDMPVNRGHMPMAEAFDPELARTLAATPEVLGRQIALIGWMLTIYAKLPPERVLRYEDTVAAPGAALAGLSKHAGTLYRDLKAYEPGDRYRDVDLAPLARALMRIQPLIGRFYPDFEATAGAYL